MRNKLAAPPIASQQLTTQHERDMKVIEAGYLGRFFGCGENVIKNVGGLLVTMLVLIILISFFVSGHLDWIDNVKTLSPFITLILGYLVGENRRQN